MSSFDNPKQLKFSITLGAGTFGTQGNTVDIAGFRAVVDIQKAGGQMMPTGTFRIYGLPLQLMNQLTTLAWKALSYTKNSVSVFAIDGEKKTQVFNGQIINAWGDFAASPDVCLYIEAQGGFYEQINPIAPKSFKGLVNVVDVYQYIADNMGLTLENNEVTVQITDPYLSGSLVDQLRSISDATKTDFFLDNTTLAICPRGIARTAKIPLIRRDTGLVGYPTFDKIGITFQSIFNPAVVFGGQIEMSSDIDPANGTWQVCSMAYRLESEKPGGAWFMNVRCTGTGLVPI